MKLPLDLDDSVAYHFYTVMIPIMKGSSQENEDFAIEFERVFKQAQVREGHKESNDER